MQDASSSPIVAEAVERLRALYGERLAAVALRAPAPGPDEFDDMDMEFIVVLRGQFRRFEEIRALSIIASDLGIEHGLAITAMPVSPDEFRDPWSMGPVHGQEISEAILVA